MNDTGRGVRAGARLRARDPGTGTFQARARTWVTGSTPPPSPGLVPVPPVPPVPARALIIAVRFSEQR